MNDVLEDLECWWREARAAPVRTDKAVEKVGALALRFTLPDDFRDYLLRSALAEDVDDDAWTSWWALDRIKNVTDEYDHKSSFEDIELNRSRYLVFADYAIWCSAWCICCVPGGNFGKIAILGGNPDHFIADSFSDLLRRYLKDPEAFTSEQYRSIICCAPDASP